MVGRAVEGRWAVKLWEKKEGLTPLSDCGYSRIYLSVSFLAPPFGRSLALTPKIAPPYTVHGLRIASQVAETQRN